MSTHDWKEDLRNWDLPREVSAFEKAPAEFRPGERIGWWFQEDEEFAREHGTLDTLLKDPPYQGVVVPREGIEMHGSKFDSEDALVIDFHGPCEKCYPEVLYGALRRLLDNDQLVRVVSLEQPAASGPQGSGWFSDAEVEAWLERHDLGSKLGLTDARAAMGDAASVHLTREAARDA